MALTKISRSLLDTGISDSSDATAITINSSEQVGIGVSPSATLQLKAASGNTGLYLQDAAGSPNISWLDAGGTVQWQVYSTMGGANGLDPLVIYSSAGEVARIDTSGNFGIGTTSPGARLDLVGPSSTPLVLEINSANSNCDITMQSANTSSVTRLRNGTNDFQVHTNGSEAMRILSNQHLLVGTTSEYSGTTGNLTAVRQIDIGENDANLKTLFFHRNAAEGEIGGIAAGVTGFSTMGRINFVAEGVAGGSQSSSIRFKTTESATESERMRIASSGRLLLNKTSSQSTPARFDVTRSSGEHAINTFVNSTSNSTIVAFWNTNGIVGTINTSGSSTSYNTSSDARLKNITGEAKGLEIINNLKPVEFEWKSSGEKADGLIAQEVEEVFPQAVSAPELDGEWYSVDYSKLVTPLIKGMQEQQKQIEELKKEIEALKN